MNGGNNSLEAVRAVMELAHDESVTTSDLADLLADLTSELQASDRDAMAVLAGIASEGCETHENEAGVAIAVIELCREFLDAAESNRPVKLQGLSPELAALMQSVYEPDATADSRVLDPERTTESSETAAGEGSPTESNETTGERVAICACTDHELLGEFLGESIDNISNAEQLILTLEESPRDEESLNGLFRAVHSIKGAAGFCEIEHLQGLAHVAESVLVRVRDGELLLKEQLFELILISVDLMSRQLHALKERYAAKKPLEYPVPPIDLIDALKTAQSTGTCAREQIARIKETLNQADGGDSKKSKSTASDSLRVDGKRLGLLIDLVGELVITEGIVQHELMGLDRLSAASVAARLRKVVRDVQQLSLTLKMVPIGTLLHKNKRMVRDLSEKLGKSTRVIIEGADTEVDKTLLEGLADPLVHLIRNSLDHGIEPTIEERVAAGKPEVATIRLSAEHRAGNIQITITDDGRGLNREKILSRAIERGLVATDHRLTDLEIDNLIFAPGFSTASTVSEVSGRGVGMDVVRKNVESMRGEIVLTSTPGKGTEIRLELPLTLSIIDGTVVRTGGRAFIIPTLAVLEQMQASSIQTSETSNGQLAMFRGRHISAHQLGEVIDAPAIAPPPHGQVCMVVETGGTSHAIFVDEILGQQPIVIKPLGSILECFEFYAGGALLSDGEIAFVLDLNAVCKKRHPPEQPLQATETQSE